MSLVRVWDLDHRARAEIRDDALLPGEWWDPPPSPVPLRCAGCGQHTPGLEEHGEICATCGEKEAAAPWPWGDDAGDDDVRDVDGHLDPADLLQKGIFAVNEILTGLGVSDRPNHRLPPDSLDWNDWLSGDELYFFLGACRGCGRPIYFEDGWDACPRCTRRAEVEGLWPLP